MSDAKPSPSKDQQYDRFMALFMGGERRIRAYVRTLLPSNQDLDDLMQNIGLACWHKFNQFDQDGSDDDFIRWCCVVARFEVLHFRRSQARDRFVLSEEVIERLATDAEERLLQSEAERQALKTCLEKLDGSQRRLLLSIHTRGDSISRIAEESNQKARRLYRKLNSLRDTVAQCVQSQLAAGET